MNPAGTITPSGGYTPQAQAQASLTDVLGQIQGMAKASTSDPASNVQGVFSDAASSALPGQVQQATQQLTQQAGIPNMQNQQGDLGKIFQMYLADQNLSQKYSSPQLNSPNSPVYSSGLQNNPQAIQGLFAGYQNQGTNPYLASPTAIINALSQPSGQGFQGFSSPGANTAAISQVPSAAKATIAGLQDLISNEKTLVNSKVEDYTTGYQKIMDHIGQLLGQGATKAYTSAQPDTSPGSLSNAGSTFNDIVTQVQAAKGGEATEYDVWNYINQHAGALKDQGVDVNELWRLQKDMATKSGKGGLISGGKTKAGAKGNLTASEVQKKNSYGAALDLAGKFVDKYGTGFSDTGADKAIPTNLLKNIPGMATSPLVNQQTAALQSDIGPLRDQIMNALSGAGVTGAESARLESWMPNAMKSKEENQRNWTSLMNYLQANYKANAQQDYGSDSSSSNQPTSGKTIKVGQYTVSY